MFTHAEYIAAYPLPGMSIPASVPAGFEPPKHAVLRPNADWGHEENPAARSLTTDDYIGALSKDEWRDAWDVATTLNVTQEAARARLLRRALESITERRMVDGRYEWRLK